MPKGYPKDVDVRGIEFLHDILNYDVDTGVWTWRVRRTWRIRAGTIAGTLNQDGARQIEINGKIYMASRLAWLYMIGEWPENEIDHINRDCADNRWANLRAATHQQNCWNRGVRKDNQNGLKGAHLDKNGKFFSAIQGAHLGMFDSVEAAHAAHLAAAAERYGEFALKGER